MAGSSEILSVAVGSYPPSYHRPMQPLESIDLLGVEVAIRPRALTETGCKRLTHIAIELFTGSGRSLYFHLSSSRLCNVCNKLLC